MIKCIANPGLLQPVKSEAVHPASVARDVGSATAGLGTVRSSSAIYDDVTAGVYALPYVADWRSSWLVWTIVTLTSRRLLAGEYSAFVVTVRKECAEAGHGSAELHGHLLLLPAGNVYWLWEVYVPRQRALVHGWCTSVDYRFVAAFLARHVSIFRIIKCAELFSTLREKKSTDHGANDHYADAPLSNRSVNQSDTGEC